MTEISRTALFGKLNRLAYKAIESATVFCKMRGNPYVELMHWIHQILQLQDSDLHRVIKQFNINPSRLAKDITEVLDRLPSGSTSITDLSFHVEEAVERGWVYGTLMFGESQVRTGHIMVACLKTPSLRHALRAISEEFDKLKLDTLTDRFDEVISGSPEEQLTATDGFQVGGGVAPGEVSAAIAPAQMGKQEALRRFTSNLTDQAREGELDPIVGRDNEIRQIIDILMRRRQNNPIITGEAGVGKTAVVEGFAQRIFAGDVPPSLQDVSLRTLDVGLLQAGASMKGEFENRLRAVIDEVQSSAKPIILFIDEAHTLIGAGGAAGTGDAANLLKPALARGTLRTIAATTWGEYKKYIEKDPALTRRFQVVQVTEPSEEKAIMMMQRVASTMEAHHRVRILDEALQASVRLSHRYIPARQLPDKSVSLLDTASARVAISQYALPAEVDDCRRRIEALETELVIIDREKMIGMSDQEREQTVRQDLKAERERLTGLEQRWESEKHVVNQLLELRNRLIGTDRKTDDDQSIVNSTAARAPLAERDAGEISKQTKSDLLIRLQDLQRELTELQGETPLILHSVDAQAVASVVSDWTGIPVGRMIKDEIETVLRLASILKRRIIGQDHALEMIARRIQTSRASLDNPSKPIGVFLLAGPSGVGKTETALALAEALYGGEQNVITFNMSEFQEAHTVSTLKGAPPGYVGYGEGGALTEAVRRRPYSVILLDEVEKAHRDVHEIFFQVFDKGWMEDGEGRKIDFKNTLILLTTNVGTDLIMSMCKDPDLMPVPDGLAQALREPLLKFFPAALLGRLVSIPYYPLGDEVFAEIVKLQLGRVEKRVEKNYRVPFSFDDEVVSLMVSRCTELESGGRMIDAILTNTVLPSISQELLMRTMQGAVVKRVHVSVTEGEFSYQID
ncbi:MAG: type VI secretion system ATPase TssH [Gammaproteobacteria bacterium]|nr:type VI secretion system ATPase TssH [Gammaproteobacteria bacterium]